MFTARILSCKKRIPGISSMCYRFFCLITLMGLSYIFLYPVIRTLTLSLALPTDLDYQSFLWVPINPTFTNYVNMKIYLEFFYHFWISVRRTVVFTIIQLVICSMVGYGLARFKFPGKNLLFALVIITIITPITTNSLPLYLDFRFFDFGGIGSLIGKLTGRALEVNLVDTDWVYYIPALFGVGLNSGLFIFTFRQSFMGMPKDLEDAAKVDGCNAFAVFARIFVPNVLPVFVTVGLLSMVFCWNDSSVSNIFIISNEKKTLINKILDMTYSINSGYTFSFQTVVYAALVLSAHAPLVLVYIVGQKFFVESMDRSGIKG